MKCDDCDFESASSRTLGQHRRQCTPDRRDRDRRIVDALKARAESDQAIAERFGVSLGLVRKLKTSAGLTGSYRRSVPKAETKQESKAKNPARPSEPKLAPLPGWHLYGMKPGGRFGAGYCVQPGCSFKAPTAGVLLRHNAAEHRVPIHTTAMVTEQLQERLNARLGRSPRSKGKARKPAADHSWKQKVVAS